MKVLDLRCAHDHRFEGWFGSEADFTDQLERRLVACPLCGDAEVSRVPSAPRLNVSHLRESPRPAAPQEPASAVSATGGEAVAATGLQMQALWMQAVRHVLAHTEDVGERFAGEARDMHYGRTETRGIRGQVSSDEAAELRDEGIEVLSIPIPPALKGPMQ
jgi:hypothetical protein